MKTFTFKSTKNIRLDVFLRNELPRCLSSYSHEAVSNAKIRRLIVFGNVLVNNTKICRPAFEIRGESVVTVFFDENSFFFERQPDDIDFTLNLENVLFEDDDLIFVNKPAFFPVEQTITNNRQNLHDCVVSYLHKKNPELRNPPYAGIMHRLDRETSGVIVFTKNRTANKAVHEVFESHSLTKKYVAVACNMSGKRPEKEFCVTKTIGRISPKSDRAKWGSLSQSKGGLYSETHFKITRSFFVGRYECFEVECSLVTGRTHQIRVHLSEEGFPVLGDTLYGAPEYDRVLLHSALLEFSAFEKHYCVKSEVPWKF